MWGLEERDKDTERKEQKGWRERTREEIWGNKAGEGERFRERDRVGDWVRILSSFTRPLHYGEGEIEVRECFVR